MEPTTDTNSTNAAKWDAAAHASAEAQTEKKQAARPPRSFSERMPCKLTDTELVVRGGQLAEALEEAEKLETERKNTNDGFKAKIELVDGRARELSNTLRTKTEYREVELVEEFVFRTNTAIVKRADTGEKVRERALTKSERQEELPLEKPAKKTNGETKAAAGETPAPTDITDPQAVLGVDATPGQPKGRRGKKK